MLRVRRPEQGLWAHWNEVCKAMFFLYQSFSFSPCTYIYIAVSTGQQSVINNCSPAATDEPGFVSLDSLRSTCRKFHIRATEEELLYVMKEVDKDGDGFVNWEEFVCIVALAPWF